MIKLDLTGLGVKKSKEFAEIIDRKHILPLEVDIPIKDDDPFKILGKDDFEKIGEIIKQLQDEKIQLYKENINLTILLEMKQKGEKMM